METDKWRTKSRRWTQQEKIETLSLEGKEESKRKIRALERRRWKKSIPQEMRLLSVTGWRNVSFQTAGNETLIGESWMDPTKSLNEKSDHFDNKKESEIIYFIYA